MTPKISLVIILGDYYNRNTEQNIFPLNSETTTVKVRIILVTLIRKCHEKFSYLQIVKIKVYIDVLVTFIWLIVTATIMPNNFMQNCISILVTVLKNFFLHLKITLYKLTNLQFKNFFRFLWLCVECLKNSISRTFPLFFVSRFMQIFMRFRKCYGCWIAIFTANEMLCVYPH